MTITDNTIVMRAPDNWHAHFREGALMEFLVGIFLQYGWFRRIVAMPNLHPEPILTGDQAIQYDVLIRAAARKHPLGELLDPIMVVQLTEQTTPEMVRQIHAKGVKVLKIYPFFVTTNSLNGVKRYTNLIPALEVAQELGMIVEFHGEDPDDKVEGLLKAVKFLLILDMIRDKLPNLKISLEHVSVADGIEWVYEQDNYVAASMTIQHMTKTLDDVAGYSFASGGKGCPTLICKPTLQMRRDRDAIAHAAFSGSPKYYYGGDDAAHPATRKYDHECSCGVWNTIPALTRLIELFEREGCLHMLEPFTSEHGAQFYGYPLNQEKIVMTKTEWEIPRRVVVPAINDYLVPMDAGQRAKWRVDRVITYSGVTITRFES